MMLALVDQIGMMYIQIGKEKDPLQIKKFLI